MPHRWTESPDSSCAAYANKPLFFQNGQVNQVNPEQRRIRCHLLENLLPPIKYWFFFENVPFILNFSSFEEERFAALLLLLPWRPCFPTWFRPFHLLERCDLKEEVLKEISITIPSSKESRSQTKCHRFRCWRKGRWERSQTRPGAEREAKNRAGLPQSWLSIAGRV